MLAKAVVKITVVVVMAMITNLTTMGTTSLPIELWEALPASTKPTISQHNHQYDVNTVQQDSAGHISKVLWDQLPPPPCKMHYI